MAAAEEQAPAARLWTRAQVEAHNSMSSAAIVIDNRVYDVTEFLEEHPGGAEILLDNAGRDASQCFRDVGHSEIALEWREQFYAGDVVEEERRAEAQRSAPPEEPAERLSLAALINVWGPPALLALLAATLYIYLF